MAGSKTSPHLVLDRFGYKWKGNRYPRVTTIKGKKSSGNALIDWAARMVAEKAQSVATEFREGKIDTSELLVRLLSDDLKFAHNQVRDEAADFGTVFHELVENIARGDQDALHVAEESLNRSVDLTWFRSEMRRDPRDETELRVFVQTASGIAEARAEAKERLWSDVEAFLDWHDVWKPVWEANEFHVGNRAPAYFGTCDAIVQIGGCRLIIDLKTSKSVYSDYALQLAAYRYADFIADAATGEESPVPVVDGTAILHVRDGQCRLLEVPTPRDVYEDFLACCRLYWSDRNAPKEFAEFQSRLFAQEAYA